MISLSRVIKNYAANADNDTFTIAIKALIAEQEEPEIENAEEDQELEALDCMKAELEEQINQLLEKKQNLEKEILEIEEDIQARLAEVQEEIEQQRNAFHKECESYKEQTYQTAHDEGYQTGLLEGKSVYDGRLDEARKIIELSHNDYVANIANSEETILRIAIEVSNRVLRKQLLEDNDIYAEYIKSAIKQVKEMKGIRIRISPTNYERVLKYKNEFQQLITVDEPLYMIPDDDIGTYDCLIDSESGRIDVGIETQIEEMKVKLLELLGGNEE